LHLLVAPDKFKGTLTALDVARAMATGARRAQPDAVIELAPLADGGEGTVPALLQALGGERRTVGVTGPLRERVEADIAVLSDGRAALEMSSAAGLSLLDQDRLDPLAASSRGVGELVSAALDAGCEQVVVGVGGSASTDGGTGAASALGWRFLDGRGHPVGDGGGALARLARIDPDGVEERLGRVEILGACDVGNPLLGEQGAARVFTPQKGASEREVEQLEEALETLAERVRVDLGVDVSACWGCGAGGGMGAGLVAFFGAGLSGGFDLVAKLVQLEEKIAAADVVVTGEGSLDAQSLAGKVPVGVASACARAGVACVAVAGVIELPREQLRSLGIGEAIALVDVVGRRRALEDPTAAVAAATESLMRGA
jgi:glycerate kinase